jgi:uncharacterized protein (TIGR02678 family)
MHLKTEAERGPAIIEASRAPHALAQDRRKDVVDEGPVEGRRSPRPLGERIERALEVQRQQALRALLLQPLLTADGEHAAEFGLVRRHASWLREWCAKHPEWSLHVDSEVARLRKCPADLADSSRGAVDRKNLSLFSRRRYVLFCLALAALEQEDRQTTLGRVAETIVKFVAADPALAAAGILFDLTTFDQRRDLVQAFRLLLDLRIVRRVHGDEEQYLNRKGDVLYSIHRPVLARVLCVRRGPSTIAAAELGDRIEEIAREPIPDSADGLNRRLRSQLMRKLLDDPVVYYADLDEKEVAYLNSQRSRLLAQVEQATGLAAEVRAEGIAMVDVRGDLTDVALPEEGTDGHLTLLVAEFLADRLRAEPDAAVGEAALQQRIAQLVLEHRRHWRKNVSEPGAEGALADQTIERLAALRLVRRVAGGILPLPAIARYALAPAPAEGSDESATRELALSERSSS